MVKVDYAYDYELDVLNIHVPDAVGYKESARLDVGIYLDFDENSNPSNLEIVDASGILGVSKEYLKNPQCKVEISINKDLINVRMILSYNENVENVFDKNIINEFNIPEMDAILAAE